MKRDKKDPKGKKETRYPYQIGVRVSKEMLDYVTKYCWQRNIGQATGIRQIIEQAMRRDN
jgi:hypothetical protein